MQSTSQITEVYASTKAYPAWWSDLEESRILRRRKSMGDSVLERNLCFVDTPGYGNKTSVSTIITLYRPLLIICSAWNALHRLSIILNLISKKHPRFQASASRR